MNPYVSWAIVLVVAGGLGWYYTNGPQPKGKTAVKTAVKPAIETVESTQSIKKPKRKTKKTPSTPSTPIAKPEEKPFVRAVSPVADQKEEEIDNKEFARQLAAVKEGITPSSNHKAAGKEKRTKKVAANPPESGSSEISGSHVSTRASSTTGADADDDLSPAGSPVLNATAPTAGYVSDMLESPAPGASVLRLTGSIESAPKKQKQQTFKPVETKKQRQQRLKNEERKLQMQEAEQQRRKLLEKQLHTAREAERRELARSKQTPPTNAWKAKNTSTEANGASKVAPTKDTGLLDTFEDEASSSAKTQQESTASSSVSGNSKQVNAPSQGKWAQELPSEEEQMRILGVSSESEWTTVSGKKGKKKADKVDEGISDASTSENQTVNDWAETKIPVIPQTYLPETFRTGEKSHPLDSDWAA